MRTAGILQVQALKLDSILEATKTISKQIETNHDIMSLLELVWKLDDPYITHQPAFEALFRTLVQDCFEEHWKEPGSDNLYKPVPYTAAAESFKHWLKLHISEFSRQCGYKEPLLVVSDPAIVDFYLASPLFPEMSELLSFTTKYNELLDPTSAMQSDEYESEIIYPLRLFQLMRLGAAQRALARTTRNYLVLGPASMAEGDEIWFLRGARVPFALRSMPNGQHEIVGEVYVHGYMQGEIFTRDARRPEDAVLVNLQCMAMTIARCARSLLIIRYLDHPASANCSIILLCDPRTEQRMSQALLAPAPICAANMQSRCA